MNNRINEHLALELEIKDLERYIATNVLNGTYEENEETEDLKKLDKLKAQKNKRPLMVTT